MVIEIERKYILANIPQCNENLKTIDEYNIEQFYLDEHRYRSEHRNGEWKFYKIKKKNISEGINEESEIEEISSNVYHSNIKKDSLIISKYRRVYKDKNNDLKFEVDQFNNIELLMLEVELPDINHQINFPENIKKQIIIEVTQYKEFSNKNLAKLIK